MYTTGDGVEANIVVVDIRYKVDMDEIVAVVDNRVCNRRTHQCHRWERLQRQRRYRPYPSFTVFLNGFHLPYNLESLPWSPYD